MPRSGSNVISRSGPLHNRLSIQDGVGCVVPADAADGASATGSAAAQQHPWMARRDTPVLRGTTGFFALLEPRPLQVAMEDVTTWHRQGFLDRFL